jgi:hypothetical protein
LCDALAGGHALSSEATMLNVIGGVTVPSMIKIMEKNFFAALDYRITQGIFFGVVLSIFWVACIIGPFTGSIFGFCGAGSLIFGAIPAVIVCN